MLILFGAPSGLIGGPDHVKLMSDRASIQQWK